MIKVSETNVQTDNKRSAGYCDDPLTDDEVRAIRALRDAYSQQELADMFKRTTAAISNIQRRKTYKHVKEDAPVLPAHAVNITLGQIWPKLTDLERKHVVWALERPDPEPLTGLQKMVQSWAAEPDEDDEDEPETEPETEGESFDDLLNQLQR